ncbi:mannose-ethanolamine phosphotransferase LAS21 [Rhodotorula paludigena]|uniref:mannose-ethanolamine phosphotransferase LAS21 n=1 Tax=Rhodotorula paludigena TaxID=86838 RepID=UPI00317A4E03
MAGAAGASTRLPARSSLSSLALLVAAVAGLALFARGFFPVKPLLAGYSAYESYADEPAFSRLAFVVVDALRSDFALGPASHMAFVASLIEQGRALPYTAVAQAPTVTLPRLKALTTGSNPTFLDAILNVAEESVSSAAFEHVDSWVRQHALQSSDDAGGGKSRKVVFAGDDTWLRLFPREWFAWHEGVSSFFVTDTQVVDSNVTRQLDALLAPATAQPESGSPPSEWDVMILHYLGLDHVGHLGGPESPLMPPKQREMDKVVKRIYERLEQRDFEDGERSLLVLVGDHGMTEGGNHGGSTEAETSAALLLAAPSLSLSTSMSRPRHDSSYKHFEVVQQIDIVPTLSALFDLGIPRNSMGKLIDSAVRALRPTAYTTSLRANAAQVAAVLEASRSGDTERILEVAAERTGEGKRPSLADASDEVLQMFLDIAQTRLLNATSSYRLTPLCAGLALLVATAGALCLRLRRLWSVESSSSKAIAGIALLAYLGSFFATSFIEEEHEFWYFATATILVLLSLSPRRNQLDRLLIVGSAGTVRLMRSWAHNGQKNVPNVSLGSAVAARPNVCATLLSLSYLVPPIVALFALARASRTYARARLPPRQLLVKAGSFAVSATVVVAQAVVGVAMHTATLLGCDATSSILLRALDKLELGAPAPLARTGYGLAAAGYALVRYRSRAGAQTDESSTLKLVHLSLLLMSVTRPANVPLFIGLWLQHAALTRLADRPDASPALLAFLTVAFQSCGYFGLGGSNSLATVDLTQAYNGVSSYSLPLVSLLTYLSNFSLPILTACSLHTLPPPIRMLVTPYLTAFHTLALATLALSATHFRYHLFSLTVFAPSVLYRAVWFLLLHLGTNLGLANVLTG